MPGHNERGVRAANTVADIAAGESQAREVAASRAVQTIADIGSQNEVHVRQILPAEDLNSGGDNGWDGEERRFIQSGLTEDEVNETYELDSDNQLEEKVVVIFAITNRADDPATTQIEFQSGTGGIFERLQVEGKLTDEQDTLLLADPVVFGATEDGTVTQYVVGDAEVDDEVIFHGVVAEQAGRTLEPSSRFVSERS